MTMWRWIATNLRLFLMALILAIAVWVSAVTAADPDETRLYPAAIPVEYVGQDSSLVLTSAPPASAQVTLQAPRSVWEKLIAQKNAVRVIVDLTGLDAGPHTVNVRVQVSLRPVRVVSVTPATLDLTLEPLVTRTLAVDVTLSGEAATGYLAGEPTAQPAMVTVAGPQSLMERLAAVRAILDLSGARQNLESTVSVQAVDVSDQPLNGLTVYPPQVTVSVPVVQQGGYRDLAVKVVVQGRVASGYRLTSISVFPPVVTVRAQDPQLVNALPGYIETEPLDLTNASANFEVPLALILPNGISVVGEPRVLVQVGIMPIEGSLTLTGRPVEIVNLKDGLRARISPQFVDVILTGPLPMLDALRLSDVRVVIDLEGLEAGTYQLQPRVEITIEGVKVESLLPETVEVTISPAA
jgi:YbbR domain-containing protein